MSVPISNNFTTNDYSAVPLRTFNKQNEEINFAQEEVQDASLQEKYFTCLYKGEYVNARMLIAQKPAFINELMNSHLDSINFCFERNNLDGALHQIEIYLNIFPAHLGLLKSKAYILHFRGEHEQVRNICDTICRLSHRTDWEKKTCEIDQREKQFRFICSKVLLRQDRCEEAYTILAPFINSAMYEKSNESEVMFLSEVCYRNNRLTEIKMMVTEQFKKFSTVDFYLKAGEILLSFSKELACEYYQDVLTHFLNNNDTRAGRYFLILACLAVRKQHFDEAKGLFEQALKKKLSKAEFDDMIGNWDIVQNSYVDEYIRYGRLDLAEKFFKNALSVKEDVRTRYSLALILFNSGKFRAALEQFKVVIWSKPFHIRALKYYTHCLTVLGHKKDSEVKNLKIFQKELLQFSERFD